MQSLHYAITAFEVSKTRKIRKTPIESGVLYDKSMTCYSALLLLETNKVMCWCEKN